MPTAVTIRKERTEIWLAPATMLTKVKGAIGTMRTSALMRSLSVDVGHRGPDGVVRPLRSGDTRLLSNVRYGQARDRDA